MRHVFINMFQMEHISAVKFDTSYEKNMSFLVIPKSPKVGRKIEKIGLGSFNNELMQDSMCKAEHSKNATGAFCVIQCRRGASIHIFAHV